MDFKDPNDNVLLVAGRVSTIFAILSSLITTVSVSFIARALEKKNDLRSLDDSLK